MRVKLVDGHLIQLQAVHQSDVMLPDLEHKGRLLLRGGLVWAPELFDCADALLQAMVCRRAGHAIFVDEVVETGHVVRDQRQQRLVLRDQCIAGLRHEESLTTAVKKDSGRHYA